MDFSYIIEKIKVANFSRYPFRHIEINNLFKKKDFERIVQSCQISVSEENDNKLFEELFRSGYKIINFPGCTQNYREYIKWHKNKNISKKTNTACEGFGVVLRLEDPRDEAIKSLFEFINSQDFVDAIADRFDIDVGSCTYDAGIQKYLDGYEISPHPDIRRKALTYMININPSHTSSDNEHHTSYLSFKPEWNYVNEFWNGNAMIDRCWVPWNWCDIKKQQRINNSIVLFSPDNDTIHAIKTEYNHLLNQRTQLYGNLWFKECPTTEKLEWEDYLLKPSQKDYLSGFKNFKKAFLSYIPTSVKDILKASTKHRNPFTNRGQSTRGKRNF